MYLNVAINEENLKYQINTLKEGQNFGELALLHENTNRTASVKSIINTTFGVL